MDTVLLLIDHPRNRQLLRDWLGTRYTIVETLPPDDPCFLFDVAILDGVTLDQRWQEIHHRKTAVQPVFLPILFYTNRHDVNMITRHLWKSIDDIIWTPIEKIELIARVEVMLRARHFSLELEAANKIKLNFLAMISHELRTPLTSIIGFSSTLLSNEFVWNKDQIQDFAQIIHTESLKMEELVSQLLDLSSLQAGTFAVQPQPVQFEDILNVSSAQIRTISAAHHFSAAVADDLPPVMADVRRIGQVMTNLIGNACKFAPEGTAIEIEVVQENGNLRIAVGDEGPGIPPEDREAVFEAFHQINRSGKHRGAGLGLAIAKHLVEAHGGSIWVTDQQPGTHIAFTLPVVDEAEG